MKFLRKLKKFTLILSVLLCFYVQLILVDAILIGTLPPYHLVAMLVVFTWLSLMWYANIYCGK